MSNDLSFLKKYKHRKILVAPLNWGLGHASRCKPIIELLRNNNSVSIASDGLALNWLKRTFPGIPFYELPGYNIKYEFHRMWMNILKASPGILRTIKKEHIILRELIHQHGFDLIISDHRLGVHSVYSESVIIAHQLKIPLRNEMLSKIVTNYQLSFIQQFDECWIPDYENSPRLSGELCRAKINIPHRFIGAISHLSPCGGRPMQYDIGVVLSGPEPARSRLEKRLIRDLKNFDHLKIAFIRGTYDSLDQHLIEEVQSLHLINIADSRVLQDIICTTSIIISRSGYSTIMDLHMTGTRAILIPTPGQPEQEYLATHHKTQNRFEIISECDLNSDSLKRAVENLSK